MTPGEFQSAALGWVAAIGTVAIAVSGAVFGVWAAIQAKTAEYHSRENSARLDRHSETLRTQNQTLTQVALRTPTSPAPKATDEECE